MELLWLCVCVCACIYVLVVKKADRRGGTVRHTGRFSSVGMCACVCVCLCEKDTRVGVKRK